MLGARGTRSRIWLALAAAAGTSLVPASADAMTLPQRPNGPLSPALARLATPAFRIKPRGEQARLLGIARSGPGSLIREGGRALVYVRFDRGAIAALPELRDAGAEVVSASRRYRWVTASVKPADLHALAAVPDVASVTPVRAPVTHAVDCEGGSIISEGVGQLQAKAAREAFSIDGAGSTVGVLSDSYDQATEAATGGPIATHAEEDIETADLPGAANSCTGQALPVAVLEDFESEEATDEGRGMLQIVHDMAPKATLSFATAFEGEASFAKSIEDLATVGAKTIVDDVGYFEEPFFQDGPIANAITKVTSTKGVSYLSAAGNDNLLDGEGNEIASWEAPEYRDSGGCPAEVAALNGEGFNSTHCLDFNPGAAPDRTFGIKVEAGETLTIDLQWAEPWEGVETDLDAFLLDANGRLIGGSVEDNLASQRPLEIVQWANESGTTQTVQLVVNRFTGPGALLKFILLQNGGGVSGVEYPRSGGGDVVGPSIMGHAGAASAISVAAVRFNNSTKPEFYSSRGPVTHYFQPFKGPVAADPIPGGEVLSKPDVAATDCGGTTFFAVFSGGEWHFCGTSAAAPHAAGAVALMRNGAPLASTSLLRESLVGTATPIGEFGPCAVGGGLVEAVGAVEAAREESTPTAPGQCEPPDSPPGQVFVAPGNWGLENPPSAESGQPQPQPQPQLPPPSLPPPETSFAKHPKKTVRIRGRSVRLVFRFRSDQSGVSFLCKVDRGAFQVCGATLGRRYTLGKHVVKVKARNSAGLTDSTPAIFGFKVERIS